MALALVLKELKSALGTPTALPTVLAVINEYVANVSSFSRDSLAPSPAATSDALFDVFHSDFDHSSPAHLAVFIFALHAIAKVLPTSSLISSWFETLLLPALKQSDIPFAVLQAVQSLILRALTNPDSGSQDKTYEFRNRILELYLNETPSVFSAEDLDSDEPESLFARIRIIWIAFSITNTHECLNHMNRIFRDETASRLPLIMILSGSLNTEEFSTKAAVLLQHTLLADILHSMLYDEPSPTFLFSLSVLVHLLPHMVLETPELVPSLLPTLYLILQKAICSEINNGEARVAADVGAITNGREEGYTSLQHYLAFLLGLFPRTTLQFIRSPAEFLTEHPPTLGYSKQVDIDEAMLRRKGQELLSIYAIPSRLLHFKDSHYFEEVTGMGSWDDYTVPRLEHECLLLCQEYESAAEKFHDPGRTRILDAPMIARLANNVPDSNELAHIVAANYHLKAEVLFERRVRKKLARYTQELRARYDELQRDSRTLKEQNMLANCFRKYNTLSTEHQKHKRDSAETIQDLKSRVKSQEGKIAELQKTTRIAKDESARLRMEVDEHRSTTAALQTQAGEDKHQITLLQTKLKEVQPKIDRLQDYEVKIDQLSKMQTLWDDDVRRFNAQTDQLNLFKSDYTKLQKRVESLEKANTELQNQAAIARRAKVEPPPTEPVEPKPSKLVESLMARIAMQEATIARLRDSQRDF